MTEFTLKTDPCGPAKVQISGTRSIRLRTEIPGPKAREIQARHMAISGLVNSPIVSAKAHGTLVYDVDGNILIDFMSGHLTGHTPDHLAATLHDSNDLVIGLSEFQTYPAAVTLCERLVGLIPGMETAVLFDHQDRASGIAKFCLMGVEVMNEYHTGFGRTGKLFAYEWEDKKPGAVLLGNFAAGFPLAALVGPAGQLGWMVGNGGSEISCRAALSVIDYVLSENLAGRASQLEQIVRERVLQWQASFPAIKGLEGRGVLLDLKLESDAQAFDVCEAALQRGLMVGYSNAGYVLLRPPLMCPEEQLYEALDVLEDALETVTKGQ